MSLHPLYTSIAKPYLSSSFFSTITEIHPNSIPMSFQRNKPYLNF